MRVDNDTPLLMQQISHRHMHHPKMTVTFRCLCLSTYICVHIYIYIYIYTHIYIYVYIYILCIHTQVDHDISLLVPEVWSRMRPEEQKADTSKLCVHAGVCVLVHAR